MPARRITGESLPSMLPLDVPTSLFIVAKEWQGHRFYALRREAPVFVIEGDTPEEVYTEADKTVASFLAKMHRCGFRN